MLLGSDRNMPGKGTWRTDVMALTVIDRETREVGVLAIPRDLYVSIPGHPPERINTVDFWATIPSTLAMGRRCSTIHCDRISASASTVSFASISPDSWN